jgi:hypothetical protein
MELFFYLSSEFAFLLFLGGGALFPFYQILIENIYKVFLVYFNLIPSVLYMVFSNRF